MAVVDIALFAVSTAAYVVLWVLSGLRAARHRPVMVRDLTAAGLRGHGPGDARVV